MDQAELFHILRGAILQGEEDRAAQIAQTAVKAGITPQTILNQCIKDALAELGQRFETGTCYLPELILGGDAAKAATGILIPLLKAGETASAVQGKAVIGASKGDLHDIGKNIVGALLAAEGMEVIDLGIDVPSIKFVDTAVDVGADIIAMSSLLTTSMPYQGEVVKLLGDTNQRHKFYVITGGGPVTPEWAAEVGADGYGREATDAVKLCREILAMDAPPPLAKPIICGALKR